MKDQIPTYLFVCLANMSRSPTAEEVFRGLAKSKEKKIRTHSAGISTFSKQPLTKNKVKNADLIFIMEDYMKIQIEKLYGIKPGRIVVLGIPDIYDRNDPVLVKILLDSLEPYLVNNN